MFITISYHCRHIYNHERLGLAYVDVAAKVALLSCVNDVTGVFIIEQSAGVVGMQSCPLFLILCVSGF